MLGEDHISKPIIRPVVTLENENRLSHNLTIAVCLKQTIKLNQCIACVACLLAVPAVLAALAALAVPAVCDALALPAALVSRAFDIESMRN